MQYPKLYETASSRQTVEVFGGYNHNLRIADGEFFDMENLTSDHYPVLSPRQRRGVYAQAAAPAGLIGKDALCYADGEDFYINGYKIEDFTLCTGCDTCIHGTGCPQYAQDKTHCPKQLVSMGAYVIILPDKKYINTQDLTDRGDIEASFTSKSNVTFSLHKLDGTQYPTYIPTEQPPEPEDQALWIDTASVPHTLKQWSEASAAWIAVGTTYVRIACEGIADNFEKYDGITITGLADAAVAEQISTEQLAQLEGSAVIWDKGDDYIAIAGLLDSAMTVTSAITITRRMPHMDYVVEAGNRLWGCRYGTALGGEVVNEIYASKLGDFKNWNCFMGISTDSWVGSVGSDGQFTGAVTHLGCPLFFKENHLHKVYISSTGAHQLQDTACRGVQRGCHKSLAITGETLFYKSRSGIMAYDGSLPQDASYALGGTAYSSAVAGAYANKYYVSMMDTQGRWHLFVYDTAKGMWHREDALHAADFCACADELYAIDAETKQIITMLGSGEQTEKPVVWMAQTGAMGITSPDRKYVSRISLRLSMELGSRVLCRVQYDSCGGWEQLFCITGTDLRSFTVPIRPKRCDHLRLRLEGTGAVKLYSLTKTLEEGSDVI